MIQVTKFISFKEFDKLSKQQQNIITLEVFYVSNSGYYYTSVKHLKKGE